MRSCDSDIQISEYDSPALFQRHFVQIYLDAGFLGHVSPTAEERPPPPQSVMRVKSFLSRAFSRTVEHLLLHDGVAYLHGM